jgi:predicted 3-demethylubiquinone-9 3-methyltransferase (glyoxalase superfamily)
MLAFRLKTKEKIGMKRINAFLWFDSKAEEAAKFYVGIFKNSKIDRITRYGEAGPGPKGSVMTMDFTLDGVRFVALNGGPQFKFTEAISFNVNCETQEENRRFGESCALRRGRQSHARRVCFPDPRYPRSIIGG